MFDDMDIQYFEDKHFSWAQNHITFEKTLMEIPLEREK